MIHTTVQGDYIEPGFAVFLAITLWITFILVVLIQRQRAKIRRQREVRFAVLASRREAYIRAANEQDEAYTEEISKNPQKRDRR